MAKKPKLIAFDLDYTLWPFWVDTHVQPPFCKDNKGYIVDARGKKVKCFEEVPNVLKMLYEANYTLAVASRTSEVRGAHQLIQLFGWDKYFSIYEIYPGCKISHFQMIKNKSKLHFSDMLFFDDERRNKNDLATIGVHTILVEHGVTTKVIQKGLFDYAH